MYVPGRRRRRSGAVKYAPPEVSRHRGHDGDRAAQGDATAVAPRPAKAARREMHFVRDKRGHSAARHWQRWSMPGLLFVVTLARLLVAAQTPLSPDEAYYWVWSKALAAGYPDHPPMVALWIKLGTLIAGETPLGVRLLGPFAAALGTWLMMRAAQDLSPNLGRAGRAAVIAPVLLNATLAVNAGAVIMTPDTPLLLFWMAALAALARLIATGNGAWWLGFGVALGLALASKYTAVLGGVGVLLWLVLVPAMRPQLRTRAPYVAAALAALIFAPVLLWNADHGWVSFVRQGGRLGDFAVARAPQYVAELVAGQIGLATPLIFVLFGAGLAWVARRARTDPASGLLACVTLVPLVVFAQHALGARVQANWPVMLYPGLALAAAVQGARQWRGAVLVGGVISAVVLLQAAFAPLRLPPVASLARLGGWNRLAVSIHVLSGGLGSSFVAADEYGLASELAFHLGAPVSAVEPRWRHFDLARAPLDIGSGLLVISNRRQELPDPAVWGHAEMVLRLERRAYGHVAESYRVYRVTPPQQISDAALLPPRAVSVGLGYDR